MRRKYLTILFPVVLIVTTWGLAGKLGVAEEHHGHKAYHHGHEHYEKKHR